MTVQGNGRVEALACAPGIPSLDEQEKRDRVPKGTYRALAAKGGLRVAEGLRVQPPSELWRAIKESWATPETVICDRFRLGELQDCVNGTPVSPRVSRWSEAAFDIRSLRKLATHTRLHPLNAAFYGVPQTRERMFLIAHHREVAATVRSSAASLSMTQS